jgi:aminoglycoside phosphotransferase (APT) family kinase protein
VDEELLAALAPVVGVRRLAYAEPPVRLGGGFYTENHAFQLAEVDWPWSAPLVVRIFPLHAPPDLAPREATVQTALVEQGYPAARVLWFHDDARLSGRQYLIMERLPGHPFLGDLGLTAIAGSAWRLLTRLPSVTASLHARLHRVDPTPVVARLSGTPAGLDRWFSHLEARVAEGADGLHEGLGWLIDHRPPPPAQPSLCHGDLWGANILVDGREVTGVLDWTLATVADPALDIGFTTMSLELAPIDASPRVQRAVASLGRGMARRYRRAYEHENPVDLSDRPYYEALRCAIEFAEVIAYRRAISEGDPGDRRRPTWDSIPDQMIEYFRARTGVSLALLPAGPAG